jgi:poly-gamma-glutamate capsule biosynthesis protein CapA/YwtB (metallophosphatase superfamily)
MSRGRHLRRSPRHRLVVALITGGLLGTMGFGAASALMEPDAPPPAAPAPTVLAAAVTTTSALSPQSTSTSSMPTTTTTTLPRTFSMLFTGDLLIHRGVSSMAASLSEEPGRLFDFRPLLEPLRPIVEGVDWAVCHLEVNLSATDDRLSSYPRFRAPGQLAADVADIGFDACTTASNHTMDHGADGVIETLGVLDRAGLRFTGTARSPEEERTSRIYDIGGVRVHHLAYTYWFNGLSVPDDMPWMSHEIDEDLILADAAEARAAGAEFVVVSLHWGEQYQHTPNPQQSELGPALLASPDIDLIIGHHAHVVQPIDLVEGEWLVYGMGNLISGDRRTLDELAVRVDVTEREGRFEVETLTAIPLQLDPTTLVVSPIAEADQSPARERILSVLESGTGWGHYDVP